ncbi:MAG TPA: hypothetical protein GX405_08585 [Rhizobiales bacterium]|nr:hypothetical protein [Hyphomicrobiales bacterium]
MVGAAQEKGRLQDIAAILLGLALLAERAAARSFPVRFLVLAILSRAEAIAWCFVAREIAAGWPDTPCLDEPPAAGHGPTDALLVALRLRMLAAALGALGVAGVRCDGAVDLPGGVPDLPLLLVVRLPWPPRASWLRHRNGQSLAFAAPP